MHNCKIKSPQHGLTLIELLIALLLGLVILLSVSQGLVTLNNSNRSQSNNALLQETGDSALAYIAFNLRSALSTPCDRFSTLHDNRGRLAVKPLKGDISAENIPDDASAENLEKLITGIGINVSITSVGDVGNQSNVSSDSLSIVSTGQRRFIKNDINYKSNQISVNGRFFAAANDTKTLYAITDCKYMDIFRATPTVTADTTTLTFPAGTQIKRNYAINDPSMVAPVNVTDIGIKKGSLVSQSQFGTSPGPLLNQVELMRILFAVDTDNNDSPDSYITAQQITGLAPGSRIMSADIYLMAKLSRVDSAWPSSYQLALPKTDEPIQATTGNPNLQTFTFTDRIPRKVFVRSVALRNNSQML